MLTPIETVWRGYRFRSRTEARWGVFLATAGIDFAYEAEGYELPSGRYLPDFWLPDVGVFIEVKGQPPNGREVQLAWELERASGRQVAFAVGAPADHDGMFLLPVEHFTGPESLPGTALFNDFGNAARNSLQAAIAASRAERFDGKPPVPSAPPSGLSKRRSW